MKSVNNARADELRAKYPIFTYAGFQHRLEGQNLYLSFDFQTGSDLHFQPQIAIELRKDAHFERIDTATFQNLAFHLGLVEMLSYWKATCSPKIHISAGALSDAQKIWWLKLLRHGMGEYFFVNKIDFTVPDFVQIESVQSNTTEVDRSQLKERSLILTSGGKDTALTLDIFETLREQTGQEFACLLLNPTRAALNLTRLANPNSTIQISRTIAPELLTLNAEGYLNGHTPFSACLAFLSLIVAYISDYKFVVVSNERSSNEGNAEFLGHTINHQYSKSREFEVDFTEYVQEYLLKDAAYYSFVRPLYEAQIARTLANRSRKNGGKYLSDFRSCNKGTKDNAWCNACPKCAFTYLSFAPFLSETELHSVFGADLLNDEKLISTFLDLLGLSESPKPFECVGTHEECRVLCELLIHRHSKSLPKVLHEISTTLPKRNTDQTKQFFSEWDEENSLPIPVADLLLSTFDSAISEHAHDA